MVIDDVPPVEAFTEALFHIQPLDAGHFADSLHHLSCVHEVTVYRLNIKREAGEQLDEAWLRPELLDREPPDARIARRRALDSNDEATAQRYFIIGLRTAHSSTDGVIGANIRTFMNKQHATMIRVTRSGWPSRRWPARRTSPRRWQPRSKAALPVRRLVPGTPPLPRAQGRMFELTAAVDPAVEPPYIYWWSEAEAH